MQESAPSHQPTEGPDRDTCWTLIHDAAAGSSQACQTFVQRYESLIRGSLAARWQHTPYLVDLDDAVQEVWVHCFQDNGALSRAEPGRGANFRAFLLGVVRRVAQAFETKMARQLRRQNPDTFHPEQLIADETSMSNAFDRAWAVSVIREALELYQVGATATGGDCLRRFELLRLRFHDGIPIRDIAKKWGEEAKRVHWAYARARQEFKTALTEVLGLHLSCSPEELEEECNRLLEHLR